MPMRFFSMMIIIAAGIYWNGFKVVDTVPWGMITSALLALVVDR